jgi:hypothetical protein
MSGIFLDPLPAIVILEPPHKPPQGSHRYRCMVCTELFRITDTSYQTVREMRREHRMYIVACFNCHRDLVPALPTDGNIGTDMNTARRLLGYR